MELYGAGEGCRFHVPADGDEVSGGLAVIDAHDGLFEDGAFVEIGCHIVAGRADQLYAALMGLVVGARAFEAWQEAVVDVENLAAVAGAHRWSASRKVVQSLS